MQLCCKEPDRHTENAGINIEFMIEVDKRKMNGRRGREGTVKGFTIHLATGRRNEIARGGTKPSEGRQC